MISPEFPRSHVIPLQMMDRPVLVGSPLRRNGRAQGQTFRVYPVDPWLPVSVFAAVGSFLYFRFSLPGRAPNKGNRATSGCPYRRHSLLNILKAGWSMGPCSVGSEIRGITTKNTKTRRQGYRQTYDRGMSVAAGFSDAPVSHPQTINRPTLLSRPQGRY